MGRIKELQKLPSPYYFSVINTPNKAIYSDFKGI